MEKLWLPVPDPLGIIERLTQEGPVQLKDPLRVALKGGVNPFSANPTWLAPEVREELQREYGEWATRMAEAFTPVGNVPAARAAAGKFRDAMMAAL